MARQRFRAIERWTRGSVSSVLGPWFNNRKTAPDLADNVGIHWVARDPTIERCRDAVCSNAAASMDGCRYGMEQGPPLGCYPCHGTAMPHNSIPRAIREIRCSKKVADLHYGRVDNAGQDVRRRKRKGCGYVGDLMVGGGGVREVSKQASNKIKSGKPGGGEETGVEVAYA